MRHVLGLPSTHCAGRLNSLRSLSLVSGHYKVSELRKKNKKKRGKAEDISAKQETVVLSVDISIGLFR